MAPLSTLQIVALNIEKHEDKNATKPNNFCFKLYPSIIISLFTQLHQYYAAMKTNFKQMKLGIK